jgi:hypothetical protein
MPRGGKREGAGRKPRDDSGKGKPTTVWLTPADREALAELGLSVAEAMRLGIKAAQRRRRAPDGVG